MKTMFFSFRQAYYNLTVNDQRMLRQHIRDKKGWNNECSFYNLLDNVSKIEDYEIVTEWFKERGISKEDVWIRIGA